MAEDLSQELARLQGTWDEAKAGGGTVLADGNYTFKIESAHVGRSQKGRLQVACKYRVMVGDHVGKEIMQYQGLDNSQSIGFFKQFMGRLELAPPENIAELPTWVGRLVGITFLGQVKNKDGFMNCYIQKRVTLDPTAPTSGSPTEGKLGM